METKVKVSKDAQGSRIKVEIPIKDFIREHKNLARILESGIQDSILKEAEAQRMELDDIIRQVQSLKSKRLVAEEMPVDDKLQVAEEMPVDDKQEIKNIIKDIEANKGTVPQLLKVGRRFGISFSGKKLLGDRNLIKQKLLSELPKKIK